MQELKSILTTHQSNIFSAKFLPSVHGETGIRAVSCAGIGSVEYSEITPSGDYISHPFNCNRSITYQVTNKDAPLHVNDSALNDRTHFPHLCLICHPFNCNRSITYQVTNKDAPLHVNDSALNDRTHFPHLCLI